MGLPEYNTFCRSFWGVMFTLEGDLFVEGSDVACEGGGVPWSSIAYWAWVFVCNTEMKLNSVRIWSIQLADIYGYDGLVFFWGGEVEVKGEIDGQE